MGHIRKNMGEFEKRAAAVLGILAQNPDKVKEHLEKETYPFPLLVDADRKVVKDYGVYVRVNFESYNIARPANFILDGEGTIRYIFIASNQADFPRDEELYRVLTL
jgi:peroxiredoxin